MVNWKVCLVKHLQGSALHNNGTATKLITPGSTLHDWQLENPPQHPPSVVMLWMVELAGQGMWSMYLLRHVICLHLKAAVGGLHCALVQQHSPTVAAVC